MIEFTESNFYKALQDFFINNNKDTFLEIEKIIINLDNAVIKEVDGNIIKTETIRQVVAESVGVAEEKVVVYE